MRKPRSRARKVTITDELVDLFRKAIAAERVMRGRPSLKQYEAALRDYHAFNRAAGLKPWERGPTWPRPDNIALQEALLAKLNEAKVKAWRKWWQRYR